MATMKANTSIRKFLLLSLLARPSVSLVIGNTLKRSFFLSSGFTNRPAVSRASGSHHAGSSSRRFLSSSAGSGPATEIAHIGKVQMEEILEDYENGGREESQYVVIDVRTEEEVYSTGKLSPNVHTLPVQVIMQANVFQLDADDFEEYCGFEKPTPDETIVFTCAAGVRSVYACQFASQAGYTKLVNYSGGSNEWFAPY